VARCWTVLLRLAYLGVANVFALLPLSSREEDAEILAPRHQLVVLQVLGERGSAGVDLVEVEAAGTSRAS
jgi:hypothetical protein